MADEHNVTADIRRTLAVFAGKGLLKEGSSMSFRKMSFRKSVLKQIPKPPNGIRFVGPLHEMADLVCGLVSASKPRET